MPTDLELQREFKAAHDRAKAVAELARHEVDLKLKQRVEARKAEIDTARANLADIEKRNAEEDEDDKRRTAEEIRLMEETDRKADLSREAAIRPGQPAIAQGSPVPAVSHGMPVTPPAPATPPSKR